jgi:hypothetical protein
MSSVRNQRFSIVARLLAPRSHFIACRQVVAAGCRWR